MECVLADIHVNDEDLLAILDSEDTAVFVDNVSKKKDKCENKFLFLNSS